MKLFYFFFSLHFFFLNTTTNNSSISITEFRVITAELFREIDLTKTYNESKFIALNQSQCNGEITKMYSTPSSYYIYKPDGLCLTKYNLQGLIIANYSIPDLFKTHFTYDNPIIHYNEFEDRIYIGSNELQRIIGLDDAGKIVYDNPVEFNFSDFAKFGENSKFIFFSPMNVYSNTETVLITDLKLKVENQLIHLPEIVKKQNLLTTNIFKYLSGKVYYSPIFSDEIYEINSNGNLKMIFNGFQQIDINNDINIEISNEFNIKSFVEVNKIKPIVNFFVTEKYILISKYIKNDLRNVLIDRKTGRAISHKDAIILNNIPNSTFSFSFDEIHYAGQNKFYSTRKIESYKKILDYANKESSGNINNPKLISTGKADRILHSFSYNFDFLFNSALNENECTVDVKIYPNPTIDRIYFKISKAQHNGNQDISIYDQRGVRVFTKQVSIHDFDSNNYYNGEFDISMLEKGIYYFSVKNSQNNVLTTKSFFKTN